ncbi:MAG: hypothetical protein ABI444_02515, partial [Candidatus Kapaibacterium sp.]
GLTYLSASSLGLLDYLSSKWGKFYVHIHEQDGGTWTEQFRRERMSHNGTPPSLFEDESGDFYGGDNDLFPLDYVYGAFKDSINFATTWPQKRDSVYSLLIGRIDNTSDSLKAYKQYTAQYDGLAGLLPGLRGETIKSLHHAKNKRFAIECAIQGWGLRDPNRPYPTFYQRPTTPEETICETIGFIANGASALNNAQAFDAGNSYTDFDAGIFCPPITYMGWAGGQDTIYVHDYNWGHRRTKLYTTLPTDGFDSLASPRYLGFSNAFRAHKYVMNRINQIYPTFKTFTWVNAYSTHLSSNIANTDSITKRDAFLKIVKTEPVNRRLRNSDGSYIDSIGKVDAPSKTFVEVGLFDDSTKGNHAVLVVNTRMWPSLMDTSDVNYYNAGLPSKDQCHTTLGDIDVRKIYMKIDTLQFGAAFRSDYYVVRDLWHPDTTWLVKADSNFAIYLKPGDAKFLYFEKAYSILVSKTGATGSQEFAFNNGRRVAERKRGTQTVTTYTRGHKLYVSYAAKGKTFGGYAEHSDQDNIATGNEEALDTVRYCSRPSIIVGS